MATLAQRLFADLTPGHDSYGDIIAYRVVMP